VEITTDDEWLVDDLSSDVPFASDRGRTRSHADESSWTFRSTAGPIAR